MKKNYIVKLALVSLLMFGLMSCNQQQKSGADLHQHTLAEAHLADTALAYLMQPVNEQVIARIPVIKAEKSSEVYTATLSGRMNYDTRMQTQIASRVGGRIERIYIKFNYQPVKKGQLIMEVYSPDLATAQRELLFISRSGNNQDGLFEAAKQKLLLLGMNESQIYKLLQYQQVNYRIPVYSPVSGFILEKAAVALPAIQPATNLSSGSMDNMSAKSSPVAANPTSAATNTPVLLREGQYITAGQSLFTVYQAEKLVAEFALKPEVAVQVKKDAKILIQPFSDKETVYSGSIGLIQPVFSEGENFALARVYLNEKGLKAGELVSGKIPLMVEQSYWLPKVAVQRLGNQLVIYKKEGKVFKPIVIKTGHATDDKIQVLDEIGHWEIASNAAYLVDSESFISVKNKEF